MKRVNTEVPSISDLPHTAPDAHKYVISEHNSRFWRVDLWHPDKYSYTTKQVTTIWGFISKSNRQIYSPVNGKTVGKVIDPKLTTKWTAMQPPKLNPLQQLF